MMTQTRLKQTKQKGHQCPNAAFQMLSPNGLPEYQNQLTDKATCDMQQFRKNHSVHGLMSPPESLCILQDFVDCQFDSLPSTAESLLLVDLFGTSCARPSRVGTCQSGLGVWKLLSDVWKLTFCKVVFKAIFTACWCGHLLVAVI